MKRQNSQEFQLLVSPEYVVQEGDLFVVLVEEQDLNKYKDLEESE